MDSDSFMDVVLKIVCLFLSIGMLLTAYAAKRASGSWLLPACIYSIAWFLFTVIPIVFLPQVPLSPLAVGYILVTCIAFSIPAAVTKWDSVVPFIESSDSSLFDRPFLRISFYTFAALTFVSLVVSSVAQGISLSALTSNFFEVSNSLIADRYNQTTASSIFTQVSNVSSYVTVCLAGLVFPGYTTWVSKLRTLVIAMTPSLLVMAIFGAKGMIFLCIAMFYAGTLVRRLRIGDHRLVDKGTFAKAGIASLVILPFLTISFLARGLYEGGGQIGVADGLLRYFASYSSAHLYAFSDWFSWNIGLGSAQFYAAENATGGFYTFMSIFQFFGDDRVVPPGVYVEYFQYDWYLQTNIYTIFRGLIVDYTIIGSIFVMMAIGALSNAIFVSMLRNPYASWSIAFYLCFAGFAYTSFIISLLIWNSAYPVFFIVSALLIINNSGDQSRRKATEVSETD